jgi:hypothetical protein
MFGHVCESELASRQASANLSGHVLPFSPTAQRASPDQKLEAPTLPIL